MRPLICLFLLLAPPNLADVAGQLEAATRTYDIAASEVLVATLEALPESDRSNDEKARVHLLCAELRRIEFERHAEAAVKERRALGKVIDAHAEAGLLVVERLAESSEKYRLKADFIGTMIRSNYRAGKMKGEMKSAVDEALRLDPANAKAIVSRAKMLIFNPSASESELREGQALLLSALAIDPALEQAKLLQARALERLGERDKAVAIWEECLRANPDCAPAGKALEAPSPPDESGRGNVK